MNMDIADKPTDADANASRRLALTVALLILLALATTGVTIYAISQSWKPFDSSTPATVFHNDNELTYGDNWCLPYGSKDPELAPKSPHDWTPVGPPSGEADLNPPTMDNPADFYQEVPLEEEKTYPPPTPSKEEVPNPECM